MAKRTEGLGADSKVPLRGLIDLFKELDPNTKNTLRSAFVDAEDLQNYFPRSVPEKQTRRRISGRIDTISVEIQSTLLGAFVKWNRLPDRRIAFYEIQVSDDSVFSSFETYTQVDTFISLENIRNTKFVRVRGVTASGQTGLFSETAIARPKISAPAVYSLNFYQRYGSGSDPVLSKKLIYSGGDVFATDSLPKFYSVFSDRFYLDRDIGGGIIWGSISSRLRAFADAGEVPWDRVRFRINGLAQSDVYSPLWTINYDEEDFHANEKFYAKPMTFYGKAGYTSSFGPYAVVLPNSLAGEGQNDPHQVVRRDAVDATFYWTSPMSSTSASRFDQGQLPSFDTIEPAHETHSLGIVEGQKTEWLVFRDFRFNIPSDSVITGIEANIKRRQFSQFQDPLLRDGGRAPVLLPLNKATPTFLGPLSIGRFPILDDANVGRFVFNEQNLAVLTSRTPTIASKAIGFSSNFTVTGWVLTSALDNTTRLIVATGNNMTASFVPGRVGFSVARRAIPPIIPPSTLWFRVPGLEVNAANFFTQSNEWFHFTCTCTHTIGTNTVSLRIYKNGVLFATTTGTPTGASAAVPYGWSPTALGTADLFDDNGVLFGAAILGGITNVGVFDKVLLAPEVLALFREGGRFDLRQNSGDYKSTSNLKHYWFFLPDQADIRDEAVHLVDQTDTIRTDLNDKAIVTESWPRLSNFFYTDLRQYGFLPIALSDGIPHDNHTAIGYQRYGGENDLWGKSSWTPSEINNFYFGLALRAINEPSNGYRGYAYVDHAKMTVYTVPSSSREVQIDVEVAAANQFYLEREIFGGIVNIIEMGERLDEA